MGKKTELQQVVRDYTLNLHKRLQGVQFKQRAPTAIKNIRKFALKEMHTRVSTGWWYDQGLERELSCQLTACDTPIFMFQYIEWVTKLVHICRKCASTLFLIDRSGLLASETFLVKCVSESRERETRMRRPRRNSIPSSNMSKLMASLNCRPRKLPERSGAL